MVSAENQIAAETKALVTKQVEFYFSDYNLAYDNFMQNELKQNENHMTLASLLKFAKLKALLPAGAGAAQLGECLATSEKLVVSGDRVARVVKLPETWEAAIADMDARTVYLKGFAKDASLESLRSQIAAFVPSEKIEGILMRRDQKTKEFKGSVYVTLADADCAETLLAAPIELGPEGERMTKTAHVRENRARVERKNDDKLKRQIPENSVLVVKNIPVDADTRFDIKQTKAAFAAFHPVGFVEQSKAEGDAGAGVVLFCRFRGANSVATFLDFLVRAKKSDATAEDRARPAKLRELFGVSQDDDKWAAVEFAALTGEAELAYWRNVKSAMKSQFEKKVAKRPARQNKKGGAARQSETSGEKAAQSGDANRGDESAPKKIKFEE